MQRGGSPVSYGRLLATRLGAAATGDLARGEYGLLVGLKDGEIGATPTSEVVSQRRTLDLSLLELTEFLQIDQCQNANQEEQQMCQGADRIDFSVW